MDDLKTDMDEAVGKSLTDGLIERINRAKDETHTGLTPRRNQLEEFMASSARMLDIQRRFIMEAESEYQVERVKLLDSYRVKLENIKFEAAQAVRKLDDEHQAKTNGAKKLLDRLATMRDMPL